MEKVEEMWSRSAFDECNEGDIFVKRLLTIAKSQEIVNVNKPDEFSLPSYYDPEMFRKGQRYFRSYSSSFGFGIFMGIFTTFSVETILNILTCTNKANTPATAYKRYTETIVYTNYFVADSPEDPHSLCTLSIASVRRKHKHGSLAGQRHNLGFINQRDMVLTLFSFISFPLIRPEFFGLPVDKENMEALLHFWRVIGHMLGVADEFNVFDGDYPTIMQRSQAIVNHIFIPCLLNAPEKYLGYLRIIVDGLKALLPEMDTETIHFLMRVVANEPGFYLCEEDRQFQLEYVKKYPLYFGDPERVKDITADILLNEGQSSTYRRLSFWDRFKIQVNLLVLRWYFSSSSWVRVLGNILNNGRLFLLVRFPVIAMIRFGKDKAYIDSSIMERHLKMKKIANKGK